MLDNIKIKLQYWLPKIWLTRLAGWGANKRAGKLTKLVIDLFVRQYNVNMQEAQQPDTASYRTFNEFFVRPLRQGIRPVDPHAHRLVQPADGVLSQFGPITDGKLIQAKNHDYTLEALLAGNYVMADLFRDGLFATIYLSPRDYHRLHMPCDGVLREMIYVPGDLFSVNLLTADNVPNLFARNERVICLFDTEFGPLAQILVGATIVGSIETVWSGVVTPPREGIIKRWTYPQAGEEGAVVLAKGEEMGRFKLGSTVINLFAAGNNLQFAAHLNTMSVTRMGEPFAEVRQDEQAPVVFPEGTELEANDAAPSPAAVTSEPAQVEGQNPAADAAGQTGHKPDAP
ncbi:archaetidylserine decarboxylase [Pectobacterium polaris]|uniref:Phosphatidylserine decarboxylase proenzyme n=1 Tax=Pectobacterium polaris TaxID=2042057 RepID=A0AAW5GAS1_9GAMM|nr:archaetidylserine decarboxylase [Pectobacterium polaris]MBN3215116.1 phosphatidylserine decarboxylase [Pectobacterium polaris]MCL6351483.1 phosphatidylserine decarboxylase [Pectobacterium polaris]MCL6368489.1 phosphatidylserine decarboxylase [Pectobacterium polaris]MCU1790422.1 phosphatidylserine decarboxylase [Pectobacterium polaris]MDE8753020.1 archaetidylserine decarboxylase [Pectobacterium polaris]